MTIKQQLEFIQNKLPKCFSQQFVLTGKKIYAHNLKVGQHLVAYVERKSTSDKVTSPPRCVYLEVIGFIDSWALDKSILDKVKPHFQYFQTAPVDEDEIYYTSVRAYKKDYDTSGLSDEGIHNSMYEEPILYARILRSKQQKQPKKPYILLRATEDERLEWHDRGLITWFELKTKSIL